MGWTLEPTQLVPIAVAAGLYGRRARTLRRRGRPVPSARVLCFAAGLAVLVLALASPLDALGEERLFSAHMAQHLLLGDLAPLFVVAGTTGPVLRPLLATRVARRLAGPAHPLVALALWAADLGLWHVPLLYDAALRHGALHALEHACFFGGGLLLWATLLGRLPAPRPFRGAARVAALGVVWLAGTALANLFLWADRPLYGPYAHAPRTWGLSPLADQRAGGGVMLVEMMLLGAAAFLVVGLAWLAEAERRQLALDARPR